MFMYNDVTSYLPAEICGLFHSNLHCQCSTLVRNIYNLCRQTLVFDLFSLKWRLMSQMLQGILKQFNDHNEHYLKSSCQWKVSIL